MGHSRCLTFYTLCLFICSSQAYLSVLYLKPRIQVILRGKKNLAKLVSKRLTHIEHDVYKPHFSVSLHYLCVFAYVCGWWYEAKSLSISAFVPIFGCRQEVSCSLAV